MKVFLKSFLVLMILAAGLSMMNGCHKEVFSTKGALTFSTDTLTFDTVFTTLGSTTQSFVIRNTQSKSLNISDIKLLGLAGSQFRISLPPYTASSSGTEFKNIDIPGHDSLYVFVEVTINPNAANNPFLVFDKVQFITNNITQNVVLEAMGQNAHYHFSDSIKVNTTWPNDKPHIIVNKNGGLPILEIVQGATLTLLPSTQIYMGPGAVITVDGGLVTSTSPAPTWADSIKFQYIRTDYAGLPGEWLGITYGRSTTGHSNINLSHVIIDQSTFGLSDEYVLDLIAQSQITTSNLNTYISDIVPTVTLNNVIIRNTTSSAMTAISTTLNATNCLFHSSDASFGAMVVLGMGGTYNITNCTFANSYSTYTSSQNPILSIVDVLPYLGSGQVGPYVTTANINNTIVGGITSQYEVNLSGLTQTSSDHITFNNCFLTTVADSITAYGASNINCIDTLGDPNSFNPSIFMMPYSNNYMPDSGSIVINAGSLSLQPSTDLYDNPRAGTKTIGAILYHH